jgi:hypothetical protein
MNEVTGISSIARGCGLWLLAAALVVCSGCGSKTDSADAKAFMALPKVDHGDNAIRGKVTFTGPPPEMKSIANQPCHDGAGPISEESVVVNPNGTLLNVFVYVKGVRSDPLPNAAVPLLDQINCQYIPHAIGVQVGQPLNVRSSDPIIHNVHFTPSKNKADNLNMMSAGAQKTVTFDAPEFIPFKCDIHPWMNAQVGVFANPFFAVTNKEGTFEISHLPAGQFTLVAWHERYGEIEKQVTVTQGQPVVVDFNYAP